MNAIDSEMVMETFLKSLEASLKDKYSCFRTEIRNTGVFCCGVHRGAKWIGKNSQCPDVSDILGLAITDLYEAFHRVEDIKVSSLSRYGNSRAFSVKSKPNSVYSAANDLWADDELDELQDLNDLDGYVY